VFTDPEKVPKANGKGAHSEHCNPSKTLKPQNLKREVAQTTSAPCDRFEEKRNSRKEESVANFSAATWERIKEALDDLLEQYDNYREENDGEFPVDSAEHCEVGVRQLFDVVHQTVPQIQTTVVPDGLHLIAEWEQQGWDLSLCFGWVVDKLIERVRAGENIRSLAYFDRAIQQGVAEMPHSR
jgi:hypothetical protein